MPFIITIRLLPWLGVLSGSSRDPPYNLPIKGATDICNAFFCGERGIRTPGPVKINSFQDCRIRPLCHLSNMSPFVMGLQRYELIRNLQIIFRFYSKKLHFDHERVKGILHFVQERSEEKNLYWKRRR